MACPMRRRIGRLLILGAALILGITAGWLVFVYLLAKMFAETFVFLLQMAATFLLAMPS